MPRGSHRFDFALIDLYDRYLRIIEASIGFEVRLIAMIFRPSAYVRSAKIPARWPGKWVEVVGYYVGKNVIRILLCVGYLWRDR